VIAGITPATWMSPVQPIAPVAQEAKGRTWDYPVGYNLWTVPRADEPIAFRELRALAENYDLLRLMIERRKDQVEGMVWRVKVADSGGQKPARNAVAAAAPRIQAITAALNFPDRVHSWRAWTRAYLEDLLVLDAPSIYPRMALGGGLYSLDIVDGTTIKPVIDADGRRPSPPSVAYQQILKGLPAVDLTADEIIYTPRNLRPHKVYGYGPVEQIIMTVNIALRRQLFQLNYYTEGNIPEAFIGVPDTWTPDQISQFQAFWDDLLEGNLAQRRHGKFVPGGMNIHETKAAGLKDEMDEWLARIICFCFGISPQPFIKEMNRATAQTGKEAAQEEGLEPLLLHLKDVFNLIISKYFKAPDLEFVWEEEDDTDPETQATILDMKQKNGQMTIDEAREIDGKDPLPGGLGAQPMVYTPSGWTLLKDVLNPPAPITAPPGAEGDNGNGQQSGKKAPQQGGQAQEKGQAGAQGAGGDAESSKGGGSKGPSGPAKKGTPAGDLHKAAKGRQVRPIDRSREAIGKATADLKKVVEKAFKAVGKAAKTIELPAQKAADDDLDARVQKILDSIDMDGFAIATDDIEEILKRIGRDGAVQALLQIGLEEEDMTDTMRAGASEYAAREAARLVKEIGPSTRDFLRADVKKAIDEGWSTAHLADELEVNYAFSPERASTIARTEIAHADTAGNMGAYRGSGVVSGKEWIAGSETDCEECEANVDAGVIDLDEEFPSGDDAPPAHPNCVCDVLPVLKEEGEE